MATLTAIFHGSCRANSQMILKLQLILAGVLLSVGACSNAPAACMGAAPTTLLAEGYCTNGEADRCFFNPKPTDGF
jgi:hypothetical protein